MENIGELTVSVVRQGGDCNRTVQVDYATEDGEAIAGKDYAPILGTITFEPGETSVQLVVKIIDDNIYEEDQHFYIRLFNLRSPAVQRVRYDTKGQVEEDAYTTAAAAAAAHDRLAPSYSTTIEIEDSPPRYSVTAREILNALSQNPHLKRPSWFHADESESEPDSCQGGEDDVFSDALSHFELDDSPGDVQDVQQQQQHIELHTIVCNQKEEDTLSRATSTVSVASSDGVCPHNSSSNNENRPKSKFPVGFSKEILSSTGPGSRSSDSDDEAAPGDQEPSPLLRLVCPSLVR